MSVNYVIDDREDAPECPGPFKICKFTADRSSFDIHIKVNRKIWLSHYGLKSTNEADKPTTNAKDHEIRFWKLICVEENGEEIVLHDQTDGTH